VDRKKDADRNRAVLSLLKSAASSGGRFLSPKELSVALRKGKATGSGRDRGASRKESDGDGIPVGGRWRQIPILGAIPAGFGDATEPTELGSIPVDLEALNIKSPSRTFALKVRGDSMLGAQIADGDLVIIEAREPKVGEVVAALIDGETTLKRFVIENGLLFLKAENPKYPDLIPLQELTVQGVVRAVVRICERSGVTR
jgi:repressor LexA